MRLLGILLLIGFISCKNKLDSSALIHFTKMTYDGPRVEYFIGYETANFDLSIKNHKLDTVGITVFTFVISKVEFDRLINFIPQNDNYKVIDVDSFALMRPKMTHVEIYSISESLYISSCVEKECKSYFNQMINLLTDNPSEGAQNLIHTITERREFEF